MISSLIQPPAKNHFRHLKAAIAPSWRELARDASYDDYLHLARTLDADHAFWSSLFADAVAGGTALVLESRLGTLSASLASCFQTVISWHASVDAAEVTRRHLDSRRITNVRVAVAETPENPCLGSESLAAAVVYGLGEDPTQQWRRDNASFLDDVMQKIPSWLSDRGVLVMGGNNRCAYRRHPLGRTGGGRKSEIMLPVLARNVRRRFLHSRIYVCGYPLTPGHAPPPDFIDHESASGMAMLPKNRIAAVKSRILNTKLVRMFWPSFLIVASNRPIRGYLETLLEGRDISESLGWDMAVKPVVKRVIAGNAGTSVIIAGPRDRQSSDVVVRFSPGTDGRRQGVMNNAAALKMLAHTTLSDKVPRLVREGLWNRRYYSVETRCSGLELDPFVQGGDTVIRQGLEVIAALKKETGRLFEVSEADFQNHLAPLILEISGFCVPEIQNRLTRLTEKLRLLAAGCSAWRGYTHGDFKLGNLLYDRSRKLTAVIDWDGFSENGYQIFDYLTYLLFSLAYESNRGLPETYLEYILPWKLPDAYAHPAEDVLPGLTSDGKSLLLMRIIFWFALLAARFDSFYKYHEAWQQKFLLPALHAFEDMLSDTGRRT